MTQERPNVWSAPEPPSWELMDRYLLRTATADEIETVVAYFRAVSASGKGADLLRDELVSPDRYPAGTVPAVIAQRIGASTIESRTRFAPRRANRAFRGRAGAWLLAASVTVIAGGIAVISRLRPSRDSELAHTYTTAIAERATITLRDGSRVQLAPASRLSVVDGYGATSRTVVLSGEAFFDVAHAQGAPFVVRTGSVSTRVLGTAFDVRHYPDDPHVRVAVVSGKVESGGSRTPVTLTAGIVGFVTDSTARTMSGDVAAYSGWTRDRLVFEDASVRAVLASVGRWYGYEFRLRDSALANQHMSAAFKLSDPAQMMQSLKQLLEVTMTFDGRVVTLSPRRKSAAPSEPRRTRDDVILPFTEVGR